MQQAAQFGTPGGRAQFCGDHKSADMVKRQRPCCWHPSVVLLHSLLRLSQWDSSLSSHLSVCVCRSILGQMHGRCEAPGCNKHPCFGTPGGSARFCMEHKSADMASHHYMILMASHTDFATATAASFNDGCTSATQVNVGIKQCEAAGCTTIAGYGYTGSRRNTCFCASHRLDGMVRQGAP